MYRTSAWMRVRSCDSVLLLAPPVRQQTSAALALRLLPTGRCKSQADLDALYPDGRRYLVDCVTGEKIYLSDKAARALEQSMSEIPEALARLETRRRAWQKAQQQRLSEHDPIL
ncbi:hypothetical protein pmac_cds_14 [Pandoravirus macleodensis]|uniref:Uncharacterized protein n=1 Tax=Pandoravirus macleodensis TaxID=2107707 RepID=A0A2U7UE68_9VIRU|nr:hypothetical protein pmac_cds_14 [Pandoravirus macleodensis]AVK76702.1 hypothetical protein pmac_cds_14 [Pandoravirus macleodensis]UMO79237.1 hypothetical protein [Pandoravirus aubagnensis]